MHSLHLTVITLLFTALSSSAATNRRLLHQPFFPLTAISQPPFPGPSPQPQPQQPKYPFSSALPPPDDDTTTTAQNPFFPIFPSPPPPPTTAFATFPANISSLVLPSSSSHSSHKTIKLVSLIVSISLFSILAFAALLFLLLVRRRNPLRTDSLRLFPPNATLSDSSSKKPPPPLFPRHTSSAASTSSSEFLYLGTLVSSRDAANNVGPPKDGAPAVSMTYQRLGSPELQPLPPLPRQQSHQKAQLYSPSDEGEEEFFSPRGSTDNNASPHHTRLSPPPLATATPFDNDNTTTNSTNYRSRSLNSLTANSPAYSLSSSTDNCPSVVLSPGSPLSVQSRSPDSLVSFPAPFPRFIPPPPARQPRAFVAFSPSSTDDCGTRDCSPRASDFSGVATVPPPTPPPPPPPARAAPHAGPPELAAPPRKVVPQNVNVGEGNSGILESTSEEMMKPKLKPLHWDKVRASSERAMVWDQLKKSSSFQ